jgi:hypothetical protein
MIIGILLAISISISLTSLLIIITSQSGILQENLATGAVIGLSQASSYATVTLVISAITTLFLISLIKKQNY